MNDLHPFFSIIIPARNSEATLRKCLTSIFIQTNALEFFEVLLIDNSSADDTKKIASEFNVKHIDCKNIGPSYARNLGVKQAQGQYILFLDSDSILEMDSLKHYREIILKLPTYYKVFQLSIVPCDADGSWSDFISKSRKNKVSFYTQKTFNPIFNKHCIPSIDTSGLIIRKDLFERTGGFNTDFKRFEDRLLGIYLLKMGELIYPILDKKVLNIYTNRTFWQFLCTSRDELENQVFVEKLLGIKFTVKRYIAIIKSTFNKEFLFTVSPLSILDQIIRGAPYGGFLLYFELISFLRPRKTDNTLPKNHFKFIEINNKSYKIDFDKNLFFYYGLEFVKIFRPHEGTQLYIPPAISSCLILIIFEELRANEAIDKVSTELSISRNTLEAKLFLFFKYAISKGIMTHARKDS